MATQGRDENREGNSEMNGNGKSDRPIVPEKASNKGSGAPESAEKLEERGLAQGKSRQFPRHRTQSRTTLRRNLWRIRQAAERRKEERFTSLWHHIYDPNRLHESYFAINRKSAPGADKVSWKSYGEQLWWNLPDLAGRMVRGVYRAMPVERVYIPKADGRKRPNGKPSLEDKVVQHARILAVSATLASSPSGGSVGGW